MNYVVTKYVIKDKKSGLLCSYASTPTMNMSNVHFYAKATHARAKRFFTENTHEVLQLSVSFNLDD